MSERETQKCKSLTDNIQLNKVANVRGGRDLTLVNPRISVLWVFNLQHPVLRVRLVDGLKPLIRGVGVSTHSQQMDVPVSYPRHLH